jgi:hypothetical protein
MSLFVNVRITESGVSRNAAVRALSGSGRSVHNLLLLLLCNVMGMWKAQSVELSLFETRTGDIVSLVMTGGMNWGGNTARERLRDAYGILFGKSEVMRLIGETKMCMIRCGLDSSGFGCAGVMGNEFRSVQGIYWPDERQLLKNHSVPECVNCT